MSYTGIPRAGSTEVLQVEGLYSALAGPYSFGLNGGECLVVSGPSGAGKSELLRMIADLDENTGEISLHGIRRQEMAAPEWRRRVVYQSAEPAWWEPTVGEHFEPSGLEEACILLAQLNLPYGILNAEISRLSTGERQRLALIRSLLIRPKVLLLDEPTGALDQVNTAAVEAVLRDSLHAGLALVLVTHSAEQAERLGNHRLEITRRKAS
ncbi:ATP-binding cassette domain-containing protein [Herbaspirillum lusitanum]|nr:ATP-binding cassette domain-containing protein [Herbaspirillum lusitanum]MCW5299406.1 ATP-binding cassette domain-containing protein [Herbaspirillum lusitanum]